MQMRAVLNSDHEAITRLLQEAFAPSGAEAALVNQLRSAHRPILEWVEQDAGGIAAYICYSRAFRNGEAIGFHLAPVAVRGNARQRGIGSALIRSSLDCAECSRAAIFVLGNPSYYGRFGFRRIQQPACPFDPANEHFLAIRWENPAPFTIGYEPEFHTCFG